MTLRQVFTAFVTVCLVVALVGCDGPAPGLNPTLTVQVAGSDKWSNIEAGSTVPLTSTSKTADNDVITKTTWTAWSANAPIGKMLVDGPVAMNNAWVAPSVINPTEVDIVLHVETRMGGKTDMIVHLVVVPRGNLPLYDFSAALFAGGTANVKEGTMIQLDGDVKVNNIIISDPTDVANYDTQLKYEWAGIYSNNEVFDHPYIKSPKWTAPTLAIDPQSGNKIPETHYLKVTVSTKNGYSSVNNIVVNVIP
jgi:hypothetical protein